MDTTIGCSLENKDIEYLKVKLEFYKACKEIFRYKYKIWFSWFTPIYEINHMRYSGICSFLRQYPISRIYYDKISDEIFDFILNSAWHESFFMSHWHRVLWINKQIRLISRELGIK